MTARASTILPGHFCRSLCGHRPGLGRSDPNLDTIQNRIWFSLRMGSHTNRDLQSAWAAHGADAFSFEPLEQLEDEELPYVRDTLLKERALH